MHQHLAKKFNRYLTHNYSLNSTIKNQIFSHSSVLKLKRLMTLAGDPTATL